MCRRRWGILAASIVLFIGASKFAVEGFSKAMALEFAPHKIRVNTVCPTFIRTPLAEQTLKIPERRRWIEEENQARAGW